MTKKKRNDNGEESTNRRSTYELNGKIVYKDSAREIRQISPELIVTNTKNPRNSLSRLFDMGYDVFVKREDSNKEHTLKEMALSEDPELRKEFCELIKKHESGDIKDDSEVLTGIPQLADSLVIHGWIHPANVRVIHEHENPDFVGMYDLIAGARRYVACLWNCAQRQNKYPVNAIVRNLDDEKASGFALEENLTILPMTVVDIIRGMAEEFRLGSSLENIAARFRTNEVTVTRRLNAAYAGDDLLAMLERREVGIVDVEKIGKRVKDGEDLNTVKEEILSRENRRGNKNGKGGRGKAKNKGNNNKADKPTESDVLSMSFAKELYLYDDTLHEKVRHWLWTHFKGFNQSEPQYRTIEQLSLEHNVMQEEDE